jgi:hypothetical protein
MGTFALTWEESQWGTASQWFIQLAQPSMLTIWLARLSQFGNLAMLASRFGLLGQLVLCMPLASWAI